MLQPSKCWDYRCVAPPYPTDFTGFLHCENDHILESKRSSKDTSWLICSQPFSLPVPARACPCFRQAHMHLITVLPCFVSGPTVSCHIVPFSLNFEYWAKVLFRSVSLKVDRVTLFVSAFEHADLFFFYWDVNLFRPQCLDIPTLPVGAPACDAHTCLRSCFSAFWHLSKNYSLLVFHLCIQSLSVITNN